MRQAVQNVVPVMTSKNGARRLGGAAEKLAVEQARASLALTAAEMGEFEWDVAADLFIVSPRMAAITGLSAGSFPARSGEYALDFAHPDDVESLRKVIGDSLLGKARYDVRYRMIRPDDGRVLWMESWAVVVRGPNRPLQRLVGVVRDITARKTEEEEREAFVAELDHRVKNVLAAVQSMALQSARRTVSIDAFIKTFSGRLEAMAAAHTLLTRTRWRGAEIRDIAAAELGGLALGRAHWNGPALVLSPRATNALTLGLHELATNALKFGALSVDAGRIDVTWETRDGGGFELSWTERGGPTVFAPTHRGFGSMLLERITGRELGGYVRIDFHAEGVTALVSADASALAGSQAAPGEPEGPAHAPPPSTGGASVGDTARRDIRDLRILIVEDSVLLALELEAALTEAGAKVVGSATSVEEAMKHLTLAFDVALLDADLNGQTVGPVAHALVARRIPFIIATGYDGLDPYGALEACPAPVVRKPYNVHQIALALKIAMDPAQPKGRLAEAGSTDKGPLHYQ